MALTAKQQSELTRIAEILSLNGQMLSLYRTGCTSGDIKERIESLDKAAKALKKAFDIK